MVGSVRLNLDSGAHIQPENGAPYALFGDSGGNFAPWSVSGVPVLGLHTLTSTPYPSRNLGGTPGTPLTISFNVINGTAPALNFNPVSATFAAVEGSTLPQTLSVALGASSGAADFALDVPGSPAWLSVAPLLGTTPGSIDVTVNPTGLAPGTYNATIDATAAGFVSASLPVTLNVVAVSEPDHVRLAWTAEPSTTLTVAWRTQQPGTPSSVEYRVSGDTTWIPATGAVRPSGTAGTLHEALLSGLTPAILYEYRVSHDNGGFSQVYSARTAPAPGPADFDLVFVADTGLVGRLDGLATGTQQVIDEIAALNPNFVLLGGDYAYFKTDNRFSTLDGAIDAWFDQVEPFSSSSPLMPTYGNHELSPGQGELYAPWASRFPTPDGFDGRRLYSFDVGDAHFISIAAWEDNNTVPASYVTWIEQDILAAKAAGKTWIIPYFHQALFADGTNHPSNTGLRLQLGSLFEAHNIDLVLTAHDQAYERTYPLSGIGTTDTPTTTAVDCFTRAEGVTFAKISPGGKLSNISGSFSPFGSTTAPSWTAVRNNQLHNFARLTFTATGNLRFEAFGVVGDGTTPVVIDSFEYRSSEPCPVPLEATPGSLTFTHLIGDQAPVAQNVTVSTFDGSASGVTVTVPQGAPWLSVTPLSGPAPLVLQVSVDPATLTEGPYTATVTTSAPGHLDGSFDVTLNVVDGTPWLVFSPVAANLSAVEGGPAFTSPASVFPVSGVADVTLFTPLLDTWLTVLPTGGLSPLPFDLMVDPTGLVPGSYFSTVTASATGFGTAVLPVSLVVTPSHPYRIVFSNSPNRSAPAQLDGAVVNGNIYAFTTPDTTPGPDPDVDIVWFYLDDPTMLGSADQVENNPPYDLAGGSSSRPNPFDTTSLIDGQHSITAKLILFDLSAIVVHADFWVANNQPALVLTPPSVSLAADLNGLPAATQTQVTTPGPVASVVVDKPAGATWLTVTPLIGETPLTLSVSANPFGLTAGIYTAIVDVAASGFSPASLSVTFEVVDNTPRLAFSASALTFNVDEGGSTPNQAVTLTAVGGNVDFTLAIPGTPSWLAITPETGITPVSPSLAITAGGLAPGTYTAVITATTTAPGVAGDSLDVTLIVRAVSAYFAGDSVADTAVSIDGVNWYVNGVVTYPGRVWVNPDSGLSRNIEGLMMNSRMASGVFDDTDGTIDPVMSPWDPRGNTEDFIAQMQSWRDHGLLAFNVNLQGAALTGLAASSYKTNPYGANGRKAFDDWNAGLSTPESEFLRRLGSIIRHADDLGMVVEVGLFHGRQDHRLQNEAAVLAAVDTTVDWILANGWTNVIIEAVNESSLFVNGVSAFEHEILRSDRVVELLERIKQRSSGPAGAHLPEGRLLVSVSGHGGFIPPDAWITASDYVIWHGNGHSAGATNTALSTLHNKSIYLANPKPIYINEHGDDQYFPALDVALSKHISWGYHNKPAYQDLDPETDTTRWTIGRAPDWWSLLSQITGISP